MWLVDSNVLIDVFGNDPQWSDRSLRLLATTSDEATLAINSMVYAELSAGFRHIERLDGNLDWLGITVLDIPRSALFLAGQQFRTYRSRAETRRTSLLPDFLIGAHAAVLGVPLITRDLRRYRTYFPTVRLITP